jgi:two-component system phosphate regulon sensor histidine kinase PhoR
MQTEMKSNIEEKMLTGTVNLEQYLNNYILDVMHPASQRIQESLENIALLGISNTEKLIRKEIERRIFVAVFLYNEKGEAIYEQTGENFNKNIDISQLQNFINNRLFQHNNEGFEYFIVKDSLNQPHPYFIYTSKLSMNNKTSYREVCVSDIGNHLLDRVIKGGISEALSVLLYDTKNNLIYKRIAPTVPTKSADLFINTVKKNYLKDVTKRKSMRLLKQVMSGNETYLIMSSYSAINKLSIISFIPADIAYAHIYQLRGFVLWHMFLLLIFILIVNYFAISIMTKPIRKLKEMAIEAGKGNFKVKTEVKSNDEIGQLTTTFNKMVKELDRFNRININKLIAEKLKLKKILQGMGDGVIVINETGEIIILNNQICDWFNCYRDETSGKKFLEVEQFSSLKEIYQNVLNDSDNQIYYKELKIEIKEKMETVFLQAGAVKIQTDTNKLIGVSIVLRNITKDKEIIRMKDEMITFIAHELRSPLVSIIGFSEYLKDGGFPEKESKEFAKIIYNDGKKMLNFINDFLDLSKLERGVSQLSKSPVEIRQYLLDKLNEYKPKTLNKNISFNAEFCDEPIDTNTYIRLFDIVIDNYISNAIKYSPENTTITIILRKDDTYYYFEVVDQGFGIAEEDQPRVFDNFFRVESNPKLKNITGTGMGLALVKKSAKQMGGYVYLESELGKGSKFGIALPVNNMDKE